MNLKEVLKNGVDADVAMCMIAQALSLLPEDPFAHSFEQFRKHKAHFCSNTSMHNYIWDIVEILEKIKAIRFDAENFKIYWIAEFDFANETIKHPDAYTVKEMK